MSDAGPHGLVRLRLRAGPERRLDLWPLVPHRLAGLDEAAIGRLALDDGGCVGDLFSVSLPHGPIGPDGTLALDGGSPLLDGVGAGMGGGTLRVEGPCGQQAGRGMRGGRLEVAGDVGRLAGCGLRGGVLVVGGSAGAGLGGALPGERFGMDGGTLLVRGDAGEGAGERLRRGLVVVEGGAGDGAGRRMVAGTLVVCGDLRPHPPDAAPAGTTGREGGPDAVETGRAGPGDAQPGEAQAGALMRRGTLLLGGTGALAPGFLPSAATPAVFQALLARALEPWSRQAASLARQATRRFLGDQAVLGLGEALRPG